jgi:SAM-dependent methyltransferase
MTGDPEKLFIQRFLESLRPRWPLGRVLSVGCGTGELERGVADQGAARHVDGVDVSESSLAAARHQAEVEGLNSIVHYHNCEAAAFLRAAVDANLGYDVVFFHGSLHHIENLEEVLDLTAAVLRGGSPGLVYVDEYVGPSRNEWTAEDLGYAAGLFSRVPLQHRRIPEMRAPIALADPTEMIRSSEILPLVRERFTAAVECPYYGNVLNPLVCAIRGSSLDEEEIQGLLRDAVDLEEFLIRRELLSPLYVALYARPR